MPARFSMFPVFGKTRTGIAFVFFHEAGAQKQERSKNKQTEAEWPEEHGLTNIRHYLVFLAGCNTAHGIPRRMALRPLSHIGSYFSLMFRVFSKPQRFSVYMRQIIF